MGTVTGISLFRTGLVGLMPGLVAMVVAAYEGPIGIAIGLGGASAGIITTAFVVWFCLWRPMPRGHPM